MTAGPIERREPLAVRLVRVDEVTRFNALLDEHHYLGHHLFGRVLRYVATEGEVWVALLGFGSAALSLSSRDTYLGWSVASRQSSGGCATSPTTRGSASCPRRGARTSPPRCSHAPSGAFLPTQRRLTGTRCCSSRPSPTPLATKAPATRRRTSCSRARPRGTGDATAPGCITATRSSAGSTRSGATRERYSPRHSTTRCSARRQGGR
ncbi:MAG: Druantia anti-phage system protein DruA [Acidimicrobiales bacterium]